MRSITSKVCPGARSIVALALLSMPVVSIEAQMAVPAPMPTPVPATASKSIFPLTPPSVSTIPGNGDVNPYGVAFVPKTVPTDGVLQQGDILVSNFNDSMNLQGTGSTIVRVSKSGVRSTFYQSSVPVVGATAALGILSDGTVIAGFMPTADGTAATAQPGALVFLDRNGKLLIGLQATPLINGPWGMAIHDTWNGTSGTALIFISNVLSGTVARMDVVYGGGLAIPAVQKGFIIASGFSHRPDPAALELGPSGLAYDAQHDILYVASSADNTIYALSGAGTTTTALGSPTVVFNDMTKLHGPLDLTFLPNGHLVVANSDGSNVDQNQPSELVEFTTSGEFTGQFSVDPNNGGAFGVNTFNVGWGTFRMAAVDDNANTLNMWTLVE